MGQGNFQVSGARVYSRLFDESENRPFEVPPVHTKKYKKELVTNATKLYVLQ